MTNGKCLQHYYERLQCYYLKNSHSLLKNHPKLKREQETEAWTPSSMKLRDISNPKPQNMKTGEWLCWKEKRHTNCLQKFVPENPPKSRNIKVPRNKEGQDRWGLITGCPFKKLRLFLTSGNLTTLTLTAPDRKTYPLEKSHQRGSSSETPETKDNAWEHLA